MGLLACREDPADAKLAAFAKAYALRPVAPSPPQDPAKVALGQALFFDPLLGGNRDVSCATCHHPRFATADGREISIGVGGEGLGPERLLAAGREDAPRNASALFNLNDPEWRTQFWDGRLEVYPDNEIKSPARGSLPAGLDNLAAVQAMFPVTSRDEMRGERGDRDRDGAHNELAQPFDSDVLTIWGGLMQRIMRVPEYQELFKEAYPTQSADSLGFEHAANAIAAFEIQAFALTDSPWDRYLGGEKSALSKAQKRGAILFFGKAQCGSCHQGALLTDQRYYNLAVPQLGPGKQPEEPLDNGRMRVSMDPADQFKFRTPALRNVTLTAPYMHSGAYATLEASIRHHINPRRAYTSYDASHLPVVLQETVLRQPQYRDLLLERVAPELEVIPELSEQELAALVEFLGALTSPGASRLERWVPERVPSGLPIE